MIIQEVISNLQDALSIDTESALDIIQKQIKKDPESEIAIAWTEYEKEQEAIALQSVEQIKDHLWSAYQNIEADLNGHKIIITDEGATIESKKKRRRGNTRTGPRCLFKLDNKNTTVVEVVIAYLLATGEDKQSKKIEYARSTLPQKDENGKVIKRQNFKNLDQWLAFTGCTSVEQWKTRLGNRLQENK